MRVLTIFGTRPEAIKLAPVVLEFGRRPERFQSVVCVTAQHREMLDSVLDVFSIRPDADLDLMSPGQTLERLTAEAIRGVAGVIADVEPDVVIVQGDTTTCFASALAAFYARVPVGHVEAGLRTGDINSPFPEEMNRRCVDAMSTYLYAPTALARQNLLREGVAEESVIVTGNTVVDAMLWARERAKSIEPPLGLDLSDKRLVLVTAHRRESFGPGIRGILQALLDIVGAVDDATIVFPIHPNPNVKGPAEEMLAGAERIVLTEPFDYLSFAWLVDNAALILSDSGGIQEEASSLGVPLLVMREVTERPEALEGGSARLVGTDRATICREAVSILRGGEARGGAPAGPCPFGDGRAAQKIADHLAGLA
ncbi:MAG: non-hydrolyzing UDP-N-acetylglucosamine 2-epimerase [Planctomycetota bacterium]|jgi:UDP-N-acetylglucosamine 2-epimerase (non-hydrolysing)